MKKVCVLLLIGGCNFIGWSQSGETDFREDFQMGLKIGANRSNVYASSGDGFQPEGKFGFATGLFASIPVNKYVGVQPEILYSEKGFKATGQILGSSYDFKRTTSYMDVPIFLTLKPSEFITILAGPQYSFLVKQRDEFANAATTIAQEQEFENDNIRKHTFCFSGGVDINVGHIVLAPRIGVML